MSRPSVRVSPQLLASLFEAAPGRIRKRLDKDPNVAQQWDWTVDDSSCRIATGTEVVSMQINQGAVRATDDVSCSCLLSPRCFHIIACLSVMEVVEDEECADELSDKGSMDVGAGEPDVATRGSESDRNFTERESITSEMKLAARHVRAAANQLIQVGARGAGALVQARILRASQQCRAAALPALGNATLRLAEGVRQVRSRSNRTDVDALRQDLTFALAISEWLDGDRQVQPWMIGTARRDFQPVDVKQLDGWFAEPILTRSGYAGVCVHLISQDGQAYQVSEVRPGTAEWVLQAYRGGIELGATVISGQRLSRCPLAVQNLNCSIDGRLGKGSKTRWVELSTRDEMSDRILDRQNEPLVNQIQRVFDQGSIPDDARRGDWNLISFQARVVGAQGPALLVEVPQSNALFRLRIAIDHPQLCFRQNLQMMARCPGLAFTAIGRIRTASAGEVDLLAVRSSQELDEDGPRLSLPPEWLDLCNVGLERLERHHFTELKRWGTEIELTESGTDSKGDDGLQELERRLAAIALGGYLAIPTIGSDTHARDGQALRGRGQPIAARLQDELARSQSARANRARTAGTERQLDGLSFDSAVLACEIYVAAARNEYHRQRWNRLVGE